MIVYVSVEIAFGTVIEIAIFDEFPSQGNGYRCIHVIVYRGSKFFEITGIWFGGSIFVVLIHMALEAEEGLLRTLE